jgi:hypothetical protein
MEAEIIYNLLIYVIVNIIYINVLKKMIILLYCKLEILKMEELYILKEFKRILD